jgi:signal transduction histidine kinase
MLDDLGLEEALRAHIRDWSPRWSTNVTLTGSQLGRLPGDVELALFRVVQEALSNVAKHALASRAEVSMSRRGRTLRLAVEDDGCGFDVEAARDSRLGLFGMQERLALIGGTLAIHSAPGRGTRVCAKYRCCAAEASPAVGERSESSEYDYAVLVLAEGAGLEPDMEVVGRRRPRQWSWSSNCAL